ncbi:MAG TPA: hypothetical protein VMZ28_08170 [Kofleriaceae bacterium]|nr:hypothetical protein [Kofleriaceae bacterium]
MGRIAGNGTIESTMRHATDDAKTMFNGVKETAIGYGERLGGLVKDHPVPAILTGVGLGFLIGRLLTR